MERTAKNKKAVASTKMTLAEFVEENHRLLSSVGIFTALTVFSSSLKPSILGAVLSLLFLTPGVLIFWELVGRIPKEKTRLLDQFENLLMLTAFVIVIYWLLAARNVHPGFVFLFLFVTISTTTIALVSKIDLWQFYTRFLRHVWMRKVVANVVGFVLLFLVFSLARLLFEPLDLFLKRVDSELRLPTEKVEKPDYREPGGPFR